MERYSIFLTPAKADFIRAARIIRKLSKIFKTPPFEPHLTLYSGELSDPNVIKNTLVTALSGTHPFSLPIRRIAYGEPYFKSLYIEFNENALLRKIHEKIRSGREMEAGHVLAPHLSLLYSEAPLREKETWAKRIVWKGSDILFDKAKIVSPQNRTEGWRDTGQWRTLFRMGLDNGK